MALKTIIDALDDAPEAVRGEYKEQTIGGKTVFVLDIEGVDSHPAVTNLKNAYERVKADKAKATTDLSTAQAIVSALPEGFTPEEYTRLKADEDARKTDPNNSDVQGQIERATTAVRSQMQGTIETLKRTHETKLAEKDAEIVKRDGEIRKRVGTDSLRAALVTAGVKKGLIEGAIAMFDRDVEVLQEDESYVAKVKGDLGGIPVAEFITNWSQTDSAKEWIAPPTGDDEPGSGGRRNSTEGNPFAAKNWNKSAQSQLIRADRARAESLAKAAGFKDLDAGMAASSARPA